MAITKETKKFCFHRLSNQVAIRVGRCYSQGIEALNSAIFVTEELATNISFFTYIARIKKLRSFWQFYSQAQGQTLVKV